jgi:hypothetical protein
MILFSITDTTLWCQAVNITREERRFFDVGEADGFLSQAVDAEPTTAMLRETEFEGV